MLIEQVLIEKPVESTWIADISYNRKQKIASMRLSNNKVYYIYNISRREFDKWHVSSSKGKFWHYNVRDFYDVKRAR